MLDAVGSAVQLDHERLDAYGVAVALDGLVVEIARRAPRGHAWLADQAQRASASVVLNLAEAMGREGADRARALRIARGSPTKGSRARARRRAEARGRSPSPRRPKSGSLSIN